MRSGWRVSWIRRWALYSHIHQLKLVKHHDGKTNAKIVSTLKLTLNTDAFANSLDKSKVYFCCHSFVRLKQTFLALAVFALSKVPQPVQEERNKSKFVVICCAQQLSQ